MMDKKKSIIKFIVMVCYLLFTFANVSVVFANMNAKSDNSEYEEDYSGENEKGKTIGHQLYDTEYHNSLYDKKNVITGGGGGNMGEGGGAAKNVGGKNLSDKGGNDSVGNTFGTAKDNGEFYKENEGDHAGVKIFELDRNGNFGFDEDHIGVSNIKGFMSFFLFAAFGLGGLTFFMATRDIKSKNNYF